MPFFSAILLIMAIKQNYTGVLFSKSVSSFIGSVFEFLKQLKLTRYALIPSLMYKARVFGIAKTVYPKKRPKKYRKS